VSVFLAWLISQVVVQLLGLVVSLVAVVPSIMEAAETGTLDGGVYGTSVLAGASVASIVTVPFLAAVAVAVYFDLRVRFEGFDIEMLNRQSGNLEIPRGHHRIGTRTIRSGSTSPEWPALRASISPKPSSGSWPNRASTLLRRVGGTDSSDVPFRRSPGCSPR
jgi:hypothetical protein